MLLDQLASIPSQGTCPVPRVILPKLQSHSFPPGLSNSFTVLTVPMHEQYCLATELTFHLYQISRRTELESKLQRKWKMIFKNILFTYFQREGKGGRKRGREISMCERNTDRLSLAGPQLGIKPATQACALTGNRTSDILFCRTTPNPLNHTSQGWKMIFLALSIHRPLKWSELAQYIRINRWQMTV